MTFGSYVENLRDIYTEHHQQNRVPDFSLFGEKRGVMFARWIGQGKRILDLGCRDGALTQYYVEGNEVVGVDIDPVALERARNKLGITVYSFDLNNAWDLPLQSFDAVVAAEIIEHLYFPENVIEKISAVLKMDGLFIGSVPNAFNLKNRLRLLLGKKAGTPLSDPTHINHFSYNELYGMLQRHFRDVEVVGFVGRERLEFLGRLSPALLSFQLIFRCSRPFLL